jgi:hypothetical protein
MAHVLHVLKGDHVRDMLATIEPQLRAGDRVTIALLGDAAAPPLPESVDTRRVPDEISYDELIELIFAADSVVTW